MAFGAAELMQGFGGGAGNEYINNTIAAQDLRSRIYHNDAMPYGSRPIYGRSRGPPPFAKYKRTNRYKNKTKKMYGRKRLRMSHSTYAPAPVEKKMHVSKDNQGSILAAVGNTTSLVAGIAQGNGYENRVGSKTYIHSLDIKATLGGDTASLIAERDCDIARIVLFVDRQANGTTPTWADLMDTRTTSINNLTDAFRNLENTSRFQVLFDKRYMLASGIFLADTPDQAGQWKSPGCKLVHIHKEFRQPLVVTYDDKEAAPAGQDGSSPHIRTNNIWIIAVADGNNSADNPKFGFTCRLRYTD